jgi:hypothetical protein
MLGGVTLCALGEFATSPVLSTIKLFRDEYERYVTTPPAHASPAADTLDEYDRAAAGEFPEKVGRG